MVKELFISFLSATLIAQVFAQQLTRVVDTPQGPVQGTVEQTLRNKQTYNAFWDIPYAEPPVGSLRFKAPRPIQPWNVTRSATTDGNRCPQTNLFELQGEYQGDEDCLTYNVYTPALDLENTVDKLAVLVYMYGGSFAQGYKDSLLYGPDYLMEENIVVVIGNYRVGVLGFLCVSHEAVSCNNGLKDQNLLLRVVKNNIAFYGGDPNRITIVGESAGGASVEYHMLSDMSIGLFHQVISQSGTPIASWTIQPLQQAELQAYELCTALGRPAVTKDQAIAILMNTTAEGLVEGTRKLNPIYHVPYWKPVIEDPRTTPANQIFISECPYDRLATGNFTKVPVMLGFTKLEFLSFSQVPDIALALLNQTVKTAPLPEQIGSIYSSLLQGTADVLEESAISSLSKYFFDSVIDQTQRYMSHFYSGSSNIPLYYYLFDFPTEYAFHRWLFNVTVLNGSGHADDNQMLWRIPIDTFQNVQYPTDPYHPFNIMAKLFTCLFANFVKTGNPTPPGNNCTNVSWEDSKLSGNQFNMSLPPAMIPRHVDAETLAYEALLPTTVPLYSGCATSTVTANPIL